MEFQGVIDMTHDLFGEMTKFLDETKFINGPGLVDHDFRTAAESARSNGDFDLKGIDLRDV